MKVDVDSGTADLADSGDVWKFYFDEPISITNSASLEVQDNNGAGDSAIVERGANSTWSLNTAAEGESDAGEVLTITLTSTLTNVNYANVLVVEAQAGITDAAGNAWDANTNDDILDRGPSQVFRDTADHNDTTFTVIFQEAVFEASAENPANYTITDTGGAVTVTSATLAADGRTVTLVTDALDASGTAVELDQTVVDTDGQAATQTNYVLVADLGPFITAGDITVEGADEVWNEVNDALEVTFSEAATYAGADADAAAGTQVSEAVLEAILGTEVTYGAGSLVTLTGDTTDTWTFTITVTALTEGVAEGDVIDGTANANVEDADGDTQIPNPVANPTVAQD